MNSQQLLVITGPIEWIAEAGVRKFFKNAVVT